MNRRSFLGLFAVACMAPAIIRGAIENSVRSSTRDITEINRYFSDHASAFQKSIYKYIWRENPYAKLFHQ